MDILEEIKKSYQMICNNSKYVKINKKNVEVLATKIKNSKLNYWLDSNPFGLLDWKEEDIIDFLLIYHTIGDYCFWGNPKWEIKVDNKTLDGSFAIMYLVVERFKKNKDFNMTKKEFKELLKGNVEIPLLDNRYENLTKMNEYLKQDKSPFSKRIEKLNEDKILLDYIINNLPYMEDSGKYKNEQVFFYKRAQLLTSDILHIKEMVGKKKVDYSHLLGCADYKIPQVMRCYNMIEFTKELEEKVDKLTPILENSEEEIEIRAATLQVIEMMYQMLDKKYTRMEINDYIWLLGQDKKQITKPYHRTLTSHY